MKLARFNEVILALAGSAFFLGVIVIVVGLILSVRESRPPPGVVVDHKGAQTPDQNLVFCPSLTESSATYQYIPVAVVVSTNSQHDAILSPPQIYARSSRSFEDCPIGRYGGSSRTFNVVIRNLANDDQRLLLDRTAQVVSFSLPSDQCAKGEGDTPCGTILWNIRTVDTNGDGTINREDVLQAFVSGIDAAKLIAMTPPDATVLGSQWIESGQKWQFQIRRDTNRDGKYTDEDGSELVESSTLSPDMAKPFLQSKITGALDASIK